MLYLGSDLALQLFHFCFIAFRTHELSLTWLLRDVPIDRTGFMDFSLFNAAIAGATKYSLFLSMEKLVDSLKIVGVRRGGFQAVNQACVFPVVVKIDVAFSMIKQPDFPAAFPSPGSAIPFRPVTSFGFRRSSAVDFCPVPAGRRCDAWQGSQCPGRCGVRAA